MVVVAEAEVCGGFPCGDGGIGPFNDILDGGIHGRHAVVAVLHGVALAKVEAEHVNLVVGQQVLIREQAEQVVSQLKGGAAYSHVKGLQHEFFGAARDGRIRAQKYPALEVQRVRHMFVLALAQEGLYGFGDRPGGIRTHNFHDFLAGVPAELQVALAAQELAREGGHTHQHARHHAGAGCHFFASLLEYARVLLVHAGGNLPVFLCAQRRQSAVHVVVEGNKPVDGLLGAKPLFREQPGVCGPLVLGLYFGIKLPGPVAAGAVSDVMADIEGFIALGSGRLRPREVLVRVHVHAHAVQALVEVLQQRFLLRNLGLRTQAEGEKKKERERFFHIDLIVFCESEGKAPAW